MNRFYQMFFTLDQQLYSRQQMKYHSQNNVYISVDYIHDTMKHQINRIQFPQRHL